MGLDTGMTFKIIPKPGYKFNINGIQLDYKKFDLIYFRKYFNLTNEIEKIMDEIDELNTISEYGCTFDGDSDGIDLILNVIKNSYNETLLGYGKEPYWDTGEVLRCEALAIHNLEVFKHYRCGRLDFLTMLDAMTEIDNKDMEVARLIEQQSEIVDWDNIEIELYISY